MTRSAQTTEMAAAYAILGVSSEDDFAAIRSAWRRLVKANHPDVAGADAEASTRRLMAINDAYDLLRTHKSTDQTASDRAQQAAEAARKAAAAKATRKAEEERVERARLEAAKAAARAAADRRRAQQAAEARRQHRAARRAEPYRHEAKPQTRSRAVDQAYAALRTAIAQPALSWTA